MKRTLRILALLCLSAIFLTVSALAEDGTIEAVECGDRILGVQFHPETDETLQHLFQCLL